MNPYSILNHVLGPVMRGPSSSHTAASHRIGLLARNLLGERPAAARVVFDPSGSYGHVYREQGSDKAFTAGLLGWPIDDDRFFKALEHAPREGLELRFALEDLRDAAHPNRVDLHLTGAGGSRLHLEAKSVGGGSVEVTGVDGWPMRLTGETHEVLALAEAAEAPALAAMLAELGPSAPGAERCGRVLLHARLPDPLAQERREALAARALWLRSAPALFLVRRGAALFSDTREMLELAAVRGTGLGDIGRAYEEALLGLPPRDVEAEGDRRLCVMEAAVAAGLSNPPPMQLLEPTAPRILAAEKEGGLAVGGIHARAAARAMAAMHANAGMGVVCAAPTGGASGVLPGVLVSLARDLGLDRDAVLDALFAAGAVGLAVLLEGDTFAAEVAGCQVEIGAAGAMAAAGVVAARGGSARQAADAAAVSLQNTMGSVCDPVQGAVEIPCHTRNAVAASSAFTCADLVLGGYMNPVPLGETLAASHQVGRMLPPELRCTALGGLSVAPSALQLKRRGN